MFKIDRAEWNSSEETIKGHSLKENKRWKTYLVEPDADDSELALGQVINWSAIAGCLLAPKCKPFVGLILNIHVIDRQISKDLHYSAVADPITIFPRS